MREPGANEELLSLITGSLDDWDEKMQEECAKAFIEPLQTGKVSLVNTQRILKLSVEITTNDDIKNESLIESWIEVFANSCGRVDVGFLRKVAIPAVKEMPASKNPMAKRQKGNRLVTAMGKNMGEEGLEEEPMVGRMIQNMCSDTNYIIRLDAAIFFKEYL